MRGFPRGTMITSELEASTRGGSKFTASAARANWVSSAEANTSTSAPSTICPARADEDAVITTTSTFGFARSKAVSMSVKAPERDDAAMTLKVVVSSPQAVTTKGTRAARSGTTSRDLMRAGYGRNVE